VPKEQLGQQDSALIIRQPSFPGAHLTIMSLVRQLWPRTEIDGALSRRPDNRDQHVSHGMQADGQREHAKQGQQHASTASRVGRAEASNRSL
jgi:hypothetical protein